MSESYGTMKGKHIQDAPNRIFMAMMGIGISRMSWIQGKEFLSSWYSVWPGISLRITPRGVWDLNFIVPDNWIHQFPFILLIAIYGTCFDCLLWYLSPNYALLLRMKIINLKYSTFLLLNANFFLLGELPTQWSGDNFFFHRRELVNLSILLKL